MRSGLGKVRHIELWLQEAIAKGRVSVEKVPGKGNLADALTKHVGIDELKISCQRDWEYYSGWKARS